MFNVFSSKIKRYYIEDFRRSMSRYNRPMWFGFSLLILQFVICLHMALAPSVMLSIASIDEDLLRIFETFIVNTDSFALWMLIISLCWNALVMISFAVDFVRSQFKILGISEKPIEMLLSFTSRIYMYILYLPFVLLSMYYISDYRSIALPNLLLSIAVAFILQIHQDSFSFAPKDSLANRLSMIDGTLVVLFEFILGICRQVIDTPELLLLIPTLFGAFKVFIAIKRCSFSIPSIRYTNLSIQLCYLLIVLTVYLSTVVTSFLSLSVIILTLLIFALKFALFVVSRQQSIKKSKLLSPEGMLEYDAVQIDYSLRQLLHQIPIDFASSRESEFSVLLEMFTVQHQVNCEKYPECFCNPTYTDQTFQSKEQNMVKYRYLIKYVRKIYKDSIYTSLKRRKTVDIRLCMSYLYFLIEIYQNKILSFSEIIRLKGMLNLSLREQQLMYRAFTQANHAFIRKEFAIQLEEKKKQQSIEKRAQKDQPHYSDEVNVLNYFSGIRFDEKMSEIEADFYVALSEKSAILTILFSDHIDLMILRMKGIALLNTREKLIADLTEMNRINSHSHRLQQFTSNFTQYFGFGQKRHHIFMKQIKNSASAIQIDQNIFNKNTCVVFITLIGDVGMIKRVQSSFETLFGYPVSQTVRKNISMILPMNMRKPHEEILVDFLKNPENSIRNTFPLLLAVNNQGWAVPISTKFRPDNIYLEDCGLTGIIEKPRNEFTYVQTSADTHRIECISQNLFEHIFEYYFSQSEITRVHLSRVIPLLNYYENVANGAQITGGAAGEKGSNTNNQNMQTVQTIAFLPKHEIFRRGFKRFHLLEKMSVEEVNEYILTKLSVEYFDMYVVKFRLYSNRLRQMNFNVLEIHQFKKIISYNSQKEAIVNFKEQVKQLLDLNMDIHNDLDILEALADLQEIHRQLHPHELHMNEENEYYNGDDQEEEGAMLIQEQFELEDTQQEIGHAVQMYHDHEASKHHNHSHQVLLPQNSSLLVSNVNAINYSAIHDSKLMEGSHIHQQHNNKFNEVVVDNVNIFPENAPRYVESAQNLNNESNQANNLVQEQSQQPQNKSQGVPDSQYAQEYYEIGLQSPSSQSVTHALFSVRSAKNLNQFTGLLSPSSSSQIQLAGLVSPTSSQQLGGLISPTSQQQLTGMLSPTSQYFPLMSPSSQQLIGQQSGSQQQIPLASAPTEQQQQQFVKSSNNFLSQQSLQAASTSQGQFNRNTTFFTSTIMRQSKKKQVTHTSSQQKKAYANKNNNHRNNEISMIFSEFYDQKFKQQQKLKDSSRSKKQKSKQQFQNLEPMFTKDIVGSSEQTNDENEETGIVRLCDMLKERVRIQRALLEIQLEKEQVHMETKFIQSGGSLIETATNKQNYFNYQQSKLSTNDLALNQNSSGQVQGRAFARNRRRLHLSHYNEASSEGEMGDSEEEAVKEFERERSRVIGATSSVKTSQTQNQEHKKSVIRMVNSRKRNLSLIFLLLFQVAALSAFSAIVLVQYFQNISSFKTAQLDFQYLPWALSQRFVFSRVFSFQMTRDYVNSGAFSSFPAPATYIPELNAQFLLEINGFKERTINFFYSNLADTNFFQYTQSTKLQYTLSVDSILLPDPTKNVTAYKLYQSISLQYFMLRLCPLFERAERVGKIDQQITLQDNFINFINTANGIQSLVSVSVVNIIKTISNQALTIMVVVIVSVVVLAFIIIPLNYHIQTKNEEVLKLFSTIPSAYLNEMYQPIQFALAAARGSMKTIKINPFNTVKKRKTISSTTSLPRINLLHFVYITVGILLMIIQPIVSYVYIKSFYDEATVLTTIITTLYNTKTYCASIQAVHSSYLVYRLQTGLAIYNPSYYSGRITTLNSQKTATLTAIYSAVDKAQATNRFEQSLYDEFFFKLASGNICDTLSQYPEYIGADIDFDTTLCYTAHGGLLTKGFQISAKEIAEQFAGLSSLYAITDTTAFKTAFYSWEATFNMKDFYDFFDLFTNTVEIMKDFLLQRVMNFISQMKSVFLFLMIYQLSMMGFIFYFGYLNFYFSVESDMFSTKRLMNILSIESVIENPYIISYLTRSE